MGGRRLMDTPRVVLLSLLFSCSAVCGAPEEKRLCSFENKTIGRNNTAHEGDDIIIEGCEVTISGSHWFNSLTIKDGGTLTCEDQNRMFLEIGNGLIIEDGGTLSCANPPGVFLEVSGDLTVEDGGMLTCADPVPNPTGVFLAVSGDLTIEALGAISVDGKGWVAGQGDGQGSEGTYGGGAGHGGIGGAGDAEGGKTYDAPDKPSTPGSGGGRGKYLIPGSREYVYADRVGEGCGGGVIRVQVGGKLDLRGRISADGTKGAVIRRLDGTLDCASGGGSGGAILIDCKDVFSNSGEITANGGEAGWVAAAGSGGGGGGMIAIYYASSAGVGDVLAVGGYGRGQIDATGKPLHQGANGTVRINGTFAASIKSPATESKRVAGKVIRFEASRMYGLPPFTYVWSFRKEIDGQSGIEDQLGVGEILQASLSEGRHTIVLSSEDASGATSEAEIVLVVLSPEVAYSASVQADVDTAPAGTPVTFTGQATWVDDTPAAETDVVLHITTRDMVRQRWKVRTGEDGRFTAVWQPLAREAGRYFISADRPNVADEPPEDEFVLFGAAIEPDAVDHRVLVGQRVTGSVMARNLGDVRLSDLSVHVENASANLFIDPNYPKALGPKTAVPLKYWLAATDASIRDAQFDVVISCGQTPVAALHGHVEVVPDSAVLATYPREIAASVVRGDQTLVDFDVVDVGGSASDVLTAYLPADAAWMSFVTPEAIGPLEPNESATVTLQLRPEATLPLATYAGDVAVADGQAEVTVPFRVDCVSAAAGSLAVTAVDEFTFYVSGEPGVAGARVRVIDAQTGRLISSADANDGGVAEFSDLAEAYYRVEVTADDHEAFGTLLRVASGDQAQLTAFLPRQLVTYRWTVLPGGTEGHYDFRVEADALTDAPVPVVVVEPLVLDLCDLGAGDTDVRYTFTNNGLLAARDVRLAFQDIAGFEFTPLVDVLDLPAQTSIEVPVRIHRSDLSVDDCNQCTVGEHELSYSLRCGEDDLLYRTPFFARACAGAGYQPPPGDGIIGAGPRVGVTSGNSSVDQVIPCPSCDARARIRVDRTTMLAGEPLTATVELDNRNSTIPLEKVRIILTIRDERGTSSESLFETPPAARGIEAAGPRDVLPAGKSFTARWFMSPAPHAACEQPQHYDFSGELTYVVNGEQVAAILYPVSITVLPNPELAVEYFLEPVVNGDDPLTDAVEPAVPFSLGMIVANYGCGPAHDVRIVSSQPTIVDDHRGRPADFRIIGTRVGRDEIEPVLNARLGDIQPEQPAVVTWAMQSSVQGMFEHYEAGLMRIDALGEQRLVRLGDVQIHELSHVVRAICPEDDGIPDFLTNSPQTHLPDALHCSDGSVHPVTTIPPTLSRIAILGNHAYLTIPGAPAGYFYGQFPDMSLSTAPLKAATRCDGVAIPVGENVWTTRRVVRPQGQPPREESLLHLFDCDGPGTYILDYNDLPRLKVDARYFLERRICGDDPITSEVEPGAPFSLGLMVRSQGYATAKDVWIIASPPKIVDHANRRLPDPNVVAVSIGSNEVSPSLQIKIGDVDVDELKVIHWVMQSPFQGRLEDWNVEFVQIDELGNRYPLDIGSSSIHELEHAVQVTWSDDDGARDFLTRERPNTYGLPDTVYLSDGSVWPEPVTGLVRMVHELVRIRDHVQIRLAVVGVPDGPFYVRYPDPTEGKRKLVAVTRSDGVSIPVGLNVWTTRRTVREPPWQPYEESLLHLFDYGGPGSYTFEYELGDWKSLQSDEP